MDELMGIIKLFAGTFAPKQFMFCEGQLLEISQNSALFSILGTTYGGNGVTNFALPDLREAVPIGANDQYFQGAESPGQKFKVDDSQMTASVKTVALRYIICVSGYFPLRD